MMGMSSPCEKRYFSKFKLNAHSSEIADKAQRLRFYLAGLIPTDLWFFSKIGLRQALAKNINASDV